MIPVTWAATTGCSTLPGTFSGPRSGALPIELADNREHSLCCGAGGGLMWTEESLGTRINHLRAGQVLAAGVSDVATSCPFCLTMLRDALKDKDRADIAVRDLAQILAEAAGVGGD